MFENDPAKQFVPLIMEKLEEEEFFLPVYHQLAAGALNAVHLCFKDGKNNGNEITPSEIADKALEIVDQILIKRNERFDKRNLHRQAEKYITLSDPWDGTYEFKDDDGYGGKINVLDNIDPDLTEVEAKGTHAIGITLKDNRVKYQYKEYEDALAVYTRLKWLHDQTHPVKTIPGIKNLF